MRADDVVRYARLLSEFIRGSVEVQSRARRSYSAGVMPTEALFALGILKFASLILMGLFDGCWMGTKMALKMQAFEVRFRDNAAKQRRLL